MRKLTAGVLAAASTALLFMGGTAHACEPPDVPCSDPVETVTCTVDEALGYQGPVKNLAYELDDCWLRP